MNTSDSLAVSRVRQIDAADAVRSSLVRQVRAAIQGVNGHRTVRRVLVDVEQRVDTADFLRSQAFETSVYWAGRGTDRSVAAVGAAEVLSGKSGAVDTDVLEDAIVARAQSLPDGARYYGGMRFDAFQATNNDYPDRGWESFGTYRFVLPRFELIQSGSEQHIVCNIVGPSDVKHIDEVVADVNRLLLPAKRQRSPGFPSPTGRTDVPARENWMSIIQGVLESISAGAVEKVVMARSATLSHDVDVDPYAVLQQLAPATPNCFHFSFDFGGDSTFVGASPERLFRQTNCTVYSEAVAGTRSRAQTTREDRALRDDLMTSDKDRREHAFVEDAIREMLAPLCTTLDSPNQRTEMKLSGGRHIWTRIEGTLNDDVSPVALLAALHPTPAVGGVPSERALETIREREGFDRGWYAGPVGWIGKDEAEFAVAIRSARIRGAQMALYSGAGIVRGSDPQEEWDEIEQKIGNFLSLVD
ncbi:isochorismate synthase [Longibacter salinarum]|uniref:Isochorismate synthase MenF n=1 Tax=Longibacter salinarum TaxID=1850348 RepID=A0A2A8D2Y1_9BACT|nr:isochorismate synthase [Longibacter salinarum]PEN15309.1 isochorismate synthase [Longibacter salinarum]